MTSRSRRRGLTLLELVIVLLILAVLTTIAVKSTEGLVAQTRFEGTSRTLRQIEEAILGDPDAQDSSGAPLPEGFVADLGRVPLAVGADPEDQAAELWSNPRALATFSLATAPSDGEVLVPCGWRGPYLVLGVGASDLRDSWATPFDLRRADGAAAADGDSIEIVTSLGEDRAAGGTSYSADLETAIRRTTVPTVDRYTASVSGRVYVRDGNGDLVDPDPGDGQFVIVVFFGPDPATGGVLEDAATIDLTATGGVASYGFAGKTIGTRTLRAYQTATNVAAATRKSRIDRFALPAGGLTRDLVLQP